MTLLDQAHAAMMADESDDGARLRFYEAFAAAELFVLLEAQESERPRLFATGEGNFVLAFDTEDRLAAFADGSAPYAALSGRTIAQMIGSNDVGIGLNLSVAPSSILLPATALAWIHKTVLSAPEQISATPESFAPPGELPETLVTSLDARLASAEGLARLAYLSRVTYRGGRQGHLLAIIDAREGAHSALAGAISEAMAFSNIDAGELDIVFLDASDPATAKLAKVGLRFDLPVPSEPSSPGGDPSKPPKLR